MLICLLSPTSGSHALVTMRWGMAVQGWDGHLEFQTPVCVLVGLSMTVSSSTHPFSTQRMYSW